VTIVAEDRPRYRSRKGDISTNVLGVCRTHLRFIYALLGWEGSAGDSRVLRDALRHQNCFRIPNGNIMNMVILYLFNGSNATI